MDTVYSVKQGVAASCSYKHNFCPCFLLCSFSAALRPHHAYSSDPKAPPWLALGILCRLSAFRHSCLSLADMTLE